MDLGLDWICTNPHITIPSDGFHFSVVLAPWALLLGATLPLAPSSIFYRLLSSLLSSRLFALHYFSLPFAILYLYIIYIISNLPYSLHLLSSYSSFIFLLHSDLLIKTQGAFYRFLLYSHVEPHTIRHTGCHQHSLLNFFHLSLFNSITTVSIVVWWCSATGKSCICLERVSL